MTSNRGFQYISEALDLERFTLFTFSPIQQRLDILCEYVATASRDGKPLKDDPVSPPANRAARDAGRGRSRARPQVRLPVEQGWRRSDDGGIRIQAVRDGALQAPRECLHGPCWSGEQLRVKSEGAPLDGRSESTYRYTVIDTIGGGSSEIQKNIIARRKLDLPRNF